MLNLIAPSEHMAWVNRINGEAASRPITSRLTEMDKMRHSKDKAESANSQDENLTVYVIAGSN